MKKFLSKALLALVFSTALLGGLSVVPHAHGDDFDHSKHQTCPIYQQDLQNLSADVIAFFALSVTLLVAFLAPSFQIFQTPASRSFLLLRAPPVIS